jgi:hypothetical protein
MIVRKAPHMSVTSLLPPLRLSGEPMSIPEQTMWIIIQAIQQTTGPHAPALLREAGLGRFLTSPLQPGSHLLVATATELGALHHGVYTILGEGGYRLFQRNHGYIVASLILKLPEIQRLAAQVPAVAPDEQVRWWVETYGAWMARAWSRVRIREDAQAFYLELDACPSCVGITGARRPLCASGEVVYGHVLREWLGRRVRVEEVACVAIGAPHCRYAIYK